MRCPPPFQPPRPLNRPEPSRGIRTVEACDSNTLEPLPSLLLFISLSRRLRGGLMSFSAYGLTRSRQLRQARTCYLVAGWKSQGENRPGSRTACTWLHERAFRIVYFEIESCKTPGRKRLASSYADLKIERNDSSLKISDLYFFIFILSFLRFCTK